MPLVELFTVEDAILLGGHKGPGMLLLEPTFPVPLGWRNSVHTPQPVLIVKPDGEQIRATARIGLSYPWRHKRMPVLSTDKDLRITIGFSELSEKDVPRGSKIMVPEDIRNAIDPTMNSH